MRIFQLAAIGAASLALCAGASAIAQSTNLLEQNDRAYGYVDLKTGQFHPVSEAKPSPDASTIKTYTGTLETTITTTIDSTFPKGTAILCDVTVNSLVLTETYTDIAAAPATISGDKATCTVKLPYAWTGPAGQGITEYYYYATYKVTASYVASATQPLTDFNVLRQVTGSLTGGVAAAIPASGTVTTLTATPVM